MDNRSVGDLATLRQRYGLSQHQFAELAQLDARTVWRYEKGVRVATESARKMALALARLQADWQRAIRPRQHPLALGCPPDWADGWGQDGYGPFVEISIEAADDSRPVVQRLRWCPPGSFDMGSPVTEAGRYDDEGPQHPVTLSEGYWLFDTPVTQALWQAVMGDNPSRFVSLERPVEQVSFEDVQRFLERLNSEKPGLQLVLPSEAQWEYGCRAGTPTATYAGDMKIVGANNAPVLQEIAWYGGNSSQGFELDNGLDTGEHFEEVAYPGKAGSHPVAQKRPNDWGLHDTLGNAWEWCADGLRDYSEEPVTDPLGPVDGDRAVRGGTWGNRARFTRAAYRSDSRPGNADDYLGFRCLRVQSA